MRPNFSAAIVAIGVCLIISGVASAQTVNRRAVLTWQAPTTCAGGATITNCPVRGYSVQKLEGTAWTEIGTTTSTVLTYTESNLALGTHRYRVLATSDNGPSAPSNEVSKVIDVPGAPGSVVVTVTVTVTS
jgi:hypothetical protein